MKHKWNCKINKKIKDKIVPYLLLVPLFLMVAILFAYPIIRVIIGAFSKISILDAKLVFVGFENYKKVFSSSIFVPTMVLTFKYAIITIFLKLFFGFIMALFMNSDIYFPRTLKFLSILPWALQQVTVAVIWKWILDGNYGYLNYYLQKFNIINANINFLSHPRIAFFMVSIVDAWLGLPMVAMMFMSGLASINPNLYEAAKVDGAGLFIRFFYITCPSMKKLFLIILTLVGIWTFNSFNVIFVLTGGGPMRSTETLIFKIYEEAFSKFDLGVSYALSVIAVLILFLFTLIYYKLDVEED